MPYYWRSNDGTRYKAEHPVRSQYENSMVLVPETDYVVSTFCRNSNTWRRIGYLIRSDVRRRRNRYSYYYRTFHRYILATVSGQYVAYASNLRQGFALLDRSNPRRIV